MSGLPGLRVAMLLCLSAGAVAQTATGIHLQSVTFEGADHLPQAAVARCTSDLKARSYEGPDWLREVAERARVICWQSRGYFKAKVMPRAEQLADADETHQFAVTLTVDEGWQYRLGDITFAGDTQVDGVDPQMLRDLIPIKGGAIFDSDKIRQGIENMRKAYGKLGYINMTSVPDTHVDDAGGLIAITWDVSSGKQFFVGKVEFDGVTEETAAALERNCPLRPDDVFDSQLLDSFVGRLHAPAGTKLDDVSVHPDNANGHVDLQFKFARISR